MEKFLFLTDLHFGYERRGGHKVTLHDSKALNVALAFAKDFRPDHIVLGGDMLDCGAVSHHNHGKPGVTEGLKLVEDAAALRISLIDPLQRLDAKTYTYITGNHERWLTDLTDMIPGLEGMLDVRTVLKLNPAWSVVPQGGFHKLGKLVFKHGDTITGGEMSSKWATVTAEANVRFGHFHTYQAFTKTTELEANGHTGIAVPCLCKNNPAYGRGKPNRWMQGFLYGYVGGPNGAFGDYLAIIVNGVSIINGKVYKG